MKRTVSLVVFCLMVGASASVGAAIPAEVEIDSGRILGTTGTSSGIRLFAGVPFAAPPVGANRWRAPQPVEPWSGVRNALEFPPRCMQGRPGATNGAPTSEDCLYLNVWTAADSAGASLPVMVWIYGGGFTGGSGIEPRYRGDGLAAKGAVVVTFNYRLGGFGFFAHPELSEESPQGISGNYGMLDTLAVLDWVQRNIEAFGGDPDNVTIFGESAGANMVATLVGTPVARGKFQRAIAESGAWMGLFGIGRMGTLERAEAAGAEQLSELGAASIDAARALPAEAVLGGLRSSGLVVDGHLIPEDLSITFAEGRQNPVDVLVGSNRDEGTFFQFGGPATAESFTGQNRERWMSPDGFFALYPAADDAQANASYLQSFSDFAAWHMREFAAAQAKIGQNAYVYRFTRVPPPPPGRPSRGATHVAEVTYVFDKLLSGTPWTETDMALADAMSSYWVNFARTGNPNGRGLPEWPTFGTDSFGRAMELGDAVRAERALTPSREALEFFDAEYAQFMKKL